MKTLAQIIKTLEDIDVPAANAMVWVGKNYSKQDLIDDLKELQKEQEVSKFDDTAQAPGNSCG